MRPIKKLGFAALAALMVVAFVGASSAMATSTTLCSGDGSGCGVTHVHETTSVKAKLLNPNQIECNVLFLGDALSGLASPLVIHGHFTYSSCTNTCSVKENEEEGKNIAEIKVLWQAAELAEVTGEALVHVKCFFGLIDCNYTGVGLVAHALGPLNGGGTNGTVKIEGQEVNKEPSKACPEEAFLDIETHPLSPIYIGT